MKARISILGKLMFVVTLTVIISIALVASTSIWREAARFGELRAAELDSTARIFASSVAQHVHKGDRGGTLRALRAVAAMDQISHIRVDNAEGLVFAELGAGVILDRDIDTSNRRDVISLLAGRPMVAAETIRHAGTEIGTIILFSHASGVWAAVWAGVKNIMLAGLAAALLGTFAASMLTRRITAPINDLMEDMSVIRKQEDYSLRVQRTTDDEIGALVDSFNDMITRVHERDDELRNQRDKLEVTVEERTRDLVVARDSAEHANAAKSDFLATMSHEIRTPMNGMLVMAELLSNADMPVKLKRYADVISKSGKSLITIINDILDLSKIEAGKLDLEDSEVLPHDLVVDVLDLFWERAASKGLDFGAWVSPDVPKAFAGDPVRIHQIVTNLTNNAIKFTEEGYVAVSVSMNDGRLRVTVTDTGIGIPADKLGSIFESFSQADQSTTRKFGGTGLGLTICKRLVDQMRGAIWVESVDGEGSDFIFEIPVEALSKPPQFTLEGCDTPLALDVDIAGAVTPRILTQVLGELLPQASFEPELQRGAHAPARLRFVDLNCAPEDWRKTTDDKVILLAPVGNSDGDSALEQGKVDALLTLPFNHARLAETISAAMTGRGRDYLSGATGGSETFLAWPEAKVLIAEDNPVNREVAFEALARFSISPVFAENGQEALDRLEEEAFDLVFMDCNMPVLDGFAATREIRARQYKGRSGTALPVLALTAQVAGTTNEDMTAAGMDSMLLKPFTLTALGECLEQWLPMPGQMNADPEPAKPAQPQTESPIETSNQASVSQPEPVQRDSEAEPLICEEALGEICAMAGPAADTFAARLYSLFAENAPGTIAMIREALDKNDYAEVSSAAHALKSMSHNMAAKRLAKQSELLEKTAAMQGGNTGEVAEQLFIAAEATLSEIARRLEKTALSSEPTQVQAS